MEECLKSVLIKCEKYKSLIEEANELRSNIAKYGQKIQNYANNAASFNNIKQDRVRERFNRIGNEINQIVPENQRINTIRYNPSCIFLSILGLLTGSLIYRIPWIMS